MELVPRMRQATGIQESILCTFLNVGGYNAATDNLDRLCEFFGCEIGDLMVYVPGKAGTDSTAPEKR